MVLIWVFPRLIVCPLQGAVVANSELSLFLVEKLQLLTITVLNMIFFFYFNYPIFTHNNFVQDYAVLINWSLKYRGNWQCICEMEGSGSREVRSSWLHFESRLVRREIVELGSFVAHSTFLSTYQVRAFIVKAIRNGVMSFSTSFYLRHLKFMEFWT